MKKNLVFKLGLFCAALVLIATCFVSSAWAKYTKEVTAQDSARVAVFAFDVKQDASIMNQSTTTTQTIDIFTTQFNHIKKNDGKNVVGTDKLIAPGSHGTCEFIVSGSTSEVSLQFVFQLAVENNNIPIEFSLDGSTWYTVDKLDDFNAAAKTKFVESCITPKNNAITKELALANNIITIPNSEPSIIVLMN